MSHARLRLKHGDREIEFEGPLEVVEAQITEWQAWVEGRSHEALRCRPARPATKHDVSSGEFISVPVSAGSVEGEHETIPRLSPEFRVRRNQTMGGLVALKEPRHDVERLLVLVYYREKYEGQSLHQASDLSRIWNEVFPTRTWQADVVDEAIARGFLEKVEPEGVTLSFRGETFVRDGLA